MGKSRRGQTRTETSDPPRASVTPWGDPDLRGVWDYWTFTPLQRPDEFAGQDTLTDEEAALVGEQARAAALATDRDGPLKEIQARMGNRSGRSVPGPRRSISLR